MPPKSSLFILLTCFFMHACNSRLLRITNKDFPSKLPQDKIEEKLRVSMNFSQNSRGRVDSRMPSRSTVSSKPKEEGAFCKKNKGNKGEKSGSQDCQSSLHKPLQYSTKPEGSRRPRLNVREKVLHSSIFREEDFIETDYHPPHRKSPIHN